MSAKNKKDKKGPRYSVDSAAKKIWLALHGDFSGTEKWPIGTGAKSALLCGTKTFRQYAFPLRGDMSPDRYKKWYQLETLLKKYRFADDLYSDDELLALTTKKYFSDQERLSSHPPRTELAFRVLQRARMHAKRILGQYDPEYTVKKSRFGKKSSIGCPLSLAYIDEKLSTVRAFTSSSECSKWFFSDCLPGDPILQELVKAFGLASVPDNLQHDSLSLVPVPKTWKTHRLITPLTLLALFYSYGVGEQVENCLSNEGLKLSKLQARHRKLICPASLPEGDQDRKFLATADLSGASDSLVSPLLNQVLPREWFCAIKKTFSHQLISDGKVHYTESVLPMGNGLTFPVETLVFYVILKAIAELSGVKGLISVYGDDLIYPSRLHKYVAVIFPMLGLRLNLDKTFVDFPFRESCGSDYYKGVDVRPCILPESRPLLSQSAYIAWLYKVYNGLTRRWDETEIRGTLSFILAELAWLTKSIYRVPPSFPDESGIKVKCPGLIPLGTNWLPWSPVIVRYYSGSRWFHFHYVIRTPEDRLVKAVLPYYWLALQGRDDLLEDKNFWETDYSVFSDAPRQSLSWETVERVRFYRGRDGKMRRKVREFHYAYTPSRTISQYTVKRNKPESVSDWL